MTPLRRFRALPRPAATSDTARMLLRRMRAKAGAEATILTVRSRPQADSRRKPRL